MNVNDRETLLGIYTMASIVTGILIAVVSIAFFAGIGSAYGENDIRQACGKVGVAQIETYGVFDLRTNSKATVVCKDGRIEGIK